MLANQTRSSSTIQARPGRAAGQVGTRWAFILITSLFFMWGLSYGLLDVLNKHFQETLHVTKAQSGLLQAAYFVAYFLVALPAGLLMQRRGYKAGILVGLGFYALGALLFVPAAGVASFPLFLLALFVIATGLGCLETAANPYATVLGDPGGAERRLNLAQSFNGLGQFIGPLLGGLLFFSGSGEAGDPGAGLGAVGLVYLAIALLVGLIALFFARTRLPEIHAEEHARATTDGRGLWRHRHFVGGVISQFFYVAAQVGVGAFFINYVTEHWQGTSSQNAAYLLSIAMLAFLGGRFFSVWLMGLIAPARLLAIYGALNVGLCALVVSGLDGVAVIALVGVFFFMSIMFPTIFALGLKNLGPHTKRASSFMIMAIVGGALMPYLMGHIADHQGTALAYAPPLVCFLVVALYGASQVRRG